MAVIRDVMPVFELFQPASIDDAITLLDKHGSDAWVLAGGLDSMDWLKDRIKRPKVVVDLSQIPELKGVREANGGVEIGAMTPLTEPARMAVEGAQPLRHNGYKVPLMRNLVKRAIRGVGATSTT